MAATARATRLSAVLHGGTESPARGDDGDDGDGEPSTTRCGRATLGPGLLGMVRSERLSLSVSAWTSQKADVGAGARPGRADGGTAGAASDCSGKSESSTKPGSCAAAAEMPWEQVRNGEGLAPVGQTEPLSRPNRAAHLVVFARKGVRGSVGRVGAELKSVLRARFSFLQQQESCPHRKLRGK